MANNKTFSKTYELVMDMEKFKKNNEKGVVLIIVLVVSVISLTLIAAIFYMVLTTISFSTKQKTYIQSIEVSKGVAQVVLDKLLSGNLTCTNCNPCDTNCIVDISDVAPKFPDFKITAVIKTKIPLTTADIYGFRITVKRKNSVEKSEIEFIYKKLK